MMEESSGHSGPPATASRLKVLIIDDTRSIVEYIKHALRSLGYQNVVEAYDGVTGLEQFYREKPDCVIVDVRMPGLDGFQVVRTIRGDLSTANTPLIILSAYQQPDKQLTGLLSGVDEYLPKPFKPSLLAAALERVMRITPEQRMRRMEHLASGGMPEPTTPSETPADGAAPRDDENLPNG